MSRLFNQKFYPFPKLSFLLFVASLLFLSIETWSCEELLKNDVFAQAVKDGISNEEYKAGMDQKKLDIQNPEEALAEKRWKTCAAIGVGDGYSILLQFRQAHPLVAEYHRRVMVFGGTERQGKLLGALQLNMNFGGRTYIMIYRHLNQQGHVTHITFKARDESRMGSGQTIRLKDPDFENPLKGSESEYLGLVSGEAYPLKFVPPSVISEEKALEKMK